MENWRLRDTLAIVIVIGVIFHAAASVDGIAQVLVAFVGVVVALLWMGVFFLEGYTDAITAE